MRAIAAGLTDIGRERNHNEDRFLLLPEFNVFVVADGMGGHQSGEVASRMAAATIATFFRTANGKAPAETPERLKAAVCDANARIFARADDSRAHRGMGTTVVAAAYHPTGNSMHFVHAGDSRAYHLRGDHLKQLTRDHSLLSDALLERPELTESDLAYLPRNVITRALGIAPTVDVDLTSCAVEPGDVFLLCSDGLHGLVDDEHMKAIMRETDVLTDACSRLVDAANRNGGKDNITAVLVRIEDEEEPWSVRSPGAIAGGPARVSQPPEGNPRGTSSRPAARSAPPVAAPPISVPPIAAVTAEPVAAADAMQVDPLRATLPDDMIPVEALPVFGDGGPSDATPLDAMPVEAIKTSTDAAPSDATPLDAMPVEAAIEANVRPGDRRTPTGEQMAAQEPKPSPPKKKLKKPRPV